MGLPGHPGGYRPGWGSVGSAEGCVQGMLEGSPVGLGAGVSCWDIALCLGFCLDADQKSCNQSVEQHGHYAMHLKRNRNGGYSRGALLSKGSSWVTQNWPPKSFVRRFRPTVYGQATLEVTIPTETLLRVEGGASRSDTGTTGINGAGQTTWMFGHPIRGVGFSVRVQSP